MVAGGSIFRFQGGPFPASWCAPGPLATAASLKCVTMAPPDMALPLAPAAAQHGFALAGAAPVTATLKRDARGSCVANPIVASSPGWGGPRHRAMGGAATATEALVAARVVEAAAASKAMVSASGEPGTGASGQPPPSHQMSPEWAAPEEATKMGSPS
eukprot:5718326-Prymnesium_polylepis.1